MRQAIMKRLPILAFILALSASPSFAQDAHGRFEKAKADFAKVIDAAKKEGELVVSAFSANTVAPEKLALFSKTYGIRASTVVLTGAQSLARIAAETSSGGLSMDVRMSAFGSEAYYLRVKGLSESFGDLPNALDPSIKWVKPFHPLMGVREGSNSIIYRATGWGFLVNTDLIPKDQAPKSWKDLADSKYRGKMIFTDPAFESVGCLVFYMVGHKYGKNWELDLLRNIANVTRVPYQPDRQVARGEFAISAPTTSASMAALYEIPEPRPFMLVAPSDGVINAPSAATMLRGPHPNAAKVWANFLLSQEAQQAEADVPGGGPLRHDVKLAAPELALHMNNPSFGDAPPSEQFIKDQDCANTTPRLMQEAGVSWTK
jgi:iron(III) transport system substrate-binding protein